MTHSIGRIKRQQGDDTRRKILDYFERNPVARQHECASDLGLSVMTVSRHMQEMRAEWLQGRKASA